MLKKVIILVIALIVAIDIGILIHNANPIVDTISDGVVPSEYQTAAYRVIVVSVSLKDNPGFCNSFMNYDPTNIDDLVEIKKQSQPSSDLNSPPAYKTVATLVITQESIATPEKQYRLFIDIGKILERDPNSGCLPNFS